MNYITYMETDNGFSDGIARVHGMNNVQAEELVEYAKHQRGIVSYTLG